jgi:hypothetical protein
VASQLRKLERRRRLGGFFYCPTPETFNRAFAGPSLFGTFKVMYRLAFTVGVKTMLTVQLLPPAITCPLHISDVMLKSPGLVPAGVTVPIVAALVPRTFTVTVCGVLLVPSFTIPNDNGEGLN